MKEITFEEKLDRLCEMQYIMIQQLNSIINYIGLYEDVPLETHTDVCGGDDEDDVERFNIKS